LRKDTEDETLAGASATGSPQGANVSKAQTEGRDTAVPLRTTTSNACLCSTVAR